MNFALIFRVGSIILHALRHMFSLSSKYILSWMREYGVVFCIIVVGIGLYYSEYFLTVSKNPREAYQEYLNRYESAMRADTVGGTTPEETRMLFVQALRSGDVVRASEYFLLNDRGSREKWMKYLRDLEVEKKLLTLADQVEQAEARGDDAITKNDFKFFGASTLGKVDMIINLELNKYSGVWKIESL